MYSWDYGLNMQNNMKPSDNYLSNRAQESFLRRRARCRTWQKHYHNNISFSCNKSSQYNRNNKIHSSLNEESLNARIWGSCNVTRIPLSPLRVFSKRNNARDGVSPTIGL
jgi:hypothetical protein